MAGVVPRPRVPQGGDTASSLVLAWVKGLPAPGKVPSARPPTRAACIRCLVL